MSEKMSSNVDGLSNTLKHLREENQQDKALLEERVPEESQRQKDRLEEIKKDYGMTDLQAKSFFFIVNDFIPWKNWNTVNILKVEGYTPICWVWIWNNGGRPALQCSKPLTPTLAVVVKVVGFGCLELVLSGMRELASALLCHKDTAY